jgi:hypothetical protein
MWWYGTPKAKYSPAPAELQATTRKDPNRHAKTSSNFLGSTAMKK